MHDWKVTMMLADAAQAVAGKLYILGGGWSICGPGPTPMAVVIDIKVPFHVSRDEHTFRLALMDADGVPVTVQSAEGEQQVAVDGGFQCGEADEHMKAGTPADASLAVNVGPVPLPPGSRLEWRLWINGRTDEDWHLGFTTRPAAASEAA
ncbi:MAG: DUF6941 family protein [Gaiellaceae bacterium]